MVYISSWAEFAEQAEELVRADILRARYSLKYITRGEAQVILKVTDDKTVRMAFNAGCFSALLTSAVA
jgi:hypothetical protein